MDAPCLPHPQLAAAVQHTVYTAGPPSSCAIAPALQCNLYGLLQLFFGFVALSLEIDFCHLASKRRLSQPTSEVSEPRCVAGWGLSGLRILSEEQ